MKSISLIPVIFSIIALGFAIFGQSKVLTPSQIDTIVDNRIAQREKELVTKYQPKLQQIEKDLGLEPSNAATLEEMASSIARIVFMPKP